MCAQKIIEIQEYATLWLWMFNHALSNMGLDGITPQSKIGHSGLEPYAYLRHVFTKLPKAGTVEAIEALLPRDLKQEQIKAS